MKLYKKRKSIFKKARNARKKTKNTRKIHGGEVVNFVNGVYEGNRYGKGIMTYTNGDRYEGDWKYDKKHGVGIMTYANGDRYEGDWNDGHRHYGKGIMTYTNGDEYDGFWRNDKKHGVGIMTYANGDRYEGDWHDGYRHGVGIFTYANGDRYEGNWNYNKKYGVGIFTYANGDEYDGFWINDKKDDNKGIFTYANGDRYEGEWKDDKKHGVGILTHANGDKEQWKNGKKLINIQKNDKITTSVYFRINDVVNKLHNNLVKTDIDTNGNSYQNITKTIDSIIENGFLCEGLDYEYISEAFDKTDAIFVIHASDVLPNETILGFALIKFLINEESLYVDIICSHNEVKGAGEYLLKKIEEISKKISKKYIKLNSVNSAITFYEKYGFVKEEKTCKDMCLMIKELRLSPSKTIKKSSSPKTKKKSKQENKGISSSKKNKKKSEEVVMDKNV